jgi:AcrR family transcriptional regulator
VGGDDDHYSTSAGDRGSSNNCQLGYYSRMVTRTAPSTRGNGHKNVTRTRKTGVASAGGKTPAAPGGKAAATRVRLLDAAAKVLGERGYAGTRLADVGEVAGVQAPAIYYHFSNKEDLAGEVFREGLRRSRRYLLRALSRLEDPDPLVRLSVAIEAHIRMGTEQSDYTAAAAARRSGEVPASVQAFCRPDERAYARIWRGLIVAAADADDLVGDLDLRTVQVMLVGALNAIAYSWKPGVVELDVVVRTALAMLLTGVSKEK